MPDAKRGKHPHASRRLAWLLAAALPVGACGHGGSGAPWKLPAAGAGAGEGQGSAAHAEVTTVNRGYRRTESQVLVRKVTRATRANLDYAAYHANFMNADPEPENAARGSGKPIETGHPFAGALEKDSLTGDFAAVPLTADERAHPLALAPLVELLASKHVAGADALEDVTSKVRAESWGQPGGPQFVRQTAELGYLHQLPAAPGWELWVKVEFAPWFHDMGALPDADRDGFGEVYGRVPAAALATDMGALVKFLHDEYAGRVLSAAEVKGWAHQLASYWYPSYNTDLIGSAGKPGAAPATWPDSETEPAVVRELGGQVFESPTVVMRGKPEGKPVYNVFLVEGLAGGGGKDAGGAAGHPGGDAAASAAPSTPRLPHTAASPEPAPVLTAIKHELAAHGGSWNRWGAEVAPLRELMERKLGAIPREAKATAGSDGFLFFGQSLAYAVGGDLEKQKRPKNPLPAIVQFRKLLAEHGVDLLFVPVPTKEEIFPDKVGTTPEERALGARFVGQVVNPFERKFLVELGDKGVEVVDLLPGFLAARTAEAPAPTPKITTTKITTSTTTPAPPAPGLFQAQDTHWTNRGLELAAHTVAERVRRYPWFAALAAHRRTYTTRPAPFSRHGDLHSRLPEADKARYAPEALVGDQVFTDAGAPYEDDPDSPIVLLGDSFTGVYELMDCEHAGVSAHLARELGYPVDLVMSYGGGPNVRQKLLRRGVEALAAKKLVIWMMTARDLHDFWEGWQMVTSR